MGLWGSIRRKVKKWVGGSNQGAQEQPTPAPELTLATDADVTGTTDEETEKEQLIKGKRKGKKGLKITQVGDTHPGRNIV